MLAILATMGPGILTAFAGNDAGGIATYSTTGAQYGLGMLWTVPLMCLLLVVVQETAARMGCATGKGFASLIREQFGVRISAVAMLSLIVSNFAVTLSEFAGIASGMLLFNVPIQVSVPVAAVATWLLTLSGSYRRIEKILLALSAVFLTYIVSGIIAQPDWGTALHSTIVPQWSSDPGYVSLLVANIGTTISPYMMFMVSSNVVEKNLGERDIAGQRADNVSGAIAAEIVTWFIILTTGTVLFPAGISVNDAADAAKALVPLAGVCLGAVRRGIGGGLVSGRLRAARHHGERSVRGLWLGARRRPQLARGPGVPRHDNCHHRNVRAHRAHPQRRPVCDHDGRPGHQRRAAAHPVVLHGKHRR